MKCVSVAMQTSETQWYRGKSHLTLHKDYSWNSNSSLKINLISF